MKPNPIDISNLVTSALTEDIGTGDLSAELIDAHQISKAHIISRQNAILCGVDYAKTVFTQVDPDIIQNWYFKDGDKLKPNTSIVTLEGRSRSILTAERSALNFLQLLSATASRTAYFVDLIKDTDTILLDTRKTIPGLRNAQKYAVTVGGGTNHRQGLYDAILIKENHIKASGSIANALQHCFKKFPHYKIMIEVENLSELEQAISAGAKHIMLDNFSIIDIQEAIKTKPSDIKLEVSGGVNERNIVEIAQTGVDYISLGTLTKDIKAIDLSLLFITF